jgi:site-specific DNA recombinase
MNTNNKQKNTYFLYARKSSESEDRQVQSIDDQIDRLKDLANRLGLNIKEILTESKSAKKPDCRPIFSDVLERIEKGEADGILCWQLNRLTRNPVDSGKLGWMLQQGTIKSIQTIDKEYLPEDNVLLFNIETGVANQFIIDLRKNSMRGTKSKAEKGWMPSGAPTGYLNDKLEQVIVKDEERFDMVRKMWDMMLTGNYVPSQILEIANNEWGFRTPKKKRSGGVPLSLGGIYRMFSNIFYTGKYFNWSGKLYDTGKHPQMITLEEFDRVQLLLGRKGKPRSKTREFAYTGIIECAECGSMVTGIEKDKIVKSTGELKSYVYFACTKRKKHNGPKCTQKPITLDKLEEQIESELEKHTIIPQFKDWALEILNKQNDQELQDRASIYENQHKSLVATQKELDSLTKMRYRELIDDDMFIKESNELKGKINTLKENLRSTESRAEKWLELTEKTFHFATYARDKFITGDLQVKREIFNSLGLNFSLKDKKVHINKADWLIPIEKAYPALQAEYNRLELDKTLTDKGKSDAFASLILDWGDYRELNPNCRYHKPE